MSETRKCPRCDATLPPGTDPDSCPRCLMQVGLENTAPGAPTMTSYGQPGRPVPSPEEIADDFPQLEILEVLGQGGMGVVYKARQKSLDRLVALKLLNVPESFGPDFAERFAREARALASLSHPSIVTVYDSGRAGERYYLMMEFVDGANLHQMIHGNELKSSQALEIVSQICDALQFAHEAGVVHRDIKPENILVDKQGRVKIADFGLAKILDQPGKGPRLTGAYQVMGTTHYMAPEQLERPLEVDHRADIYSLGVVFYELLTGELPIGRFQPPSNKVQVDVRLDDVVLRTLEKEPHLRYQKVSEVRTAVDGISGVPSPPESVHGWRGWGPWAIGAVLVLAILALMLLIDRDTGDETEGVVVTESAGTASSPATTTTERRATPLIIAAARGQAQVVASLIEAGTNVNARGFQETTALIEAVDAGYTEIAETLIDHGADVNAARSRGTTALIIAAARGQETTVQILLKHGADVNARGSHGSTALIEAVDGGYKEIALLLLENSADVNAARDRGATPLIIAAARGQTKIVGALIEKGADVNAAGSHRSALTEAVDSGHEEIVAMLLAAGANP